MPNSNGLGVGTGSAGTEQPNANVADQIEQQIQHKEQQQANQDAARLAAAQNAAASANTERQNKRAFVAMVNRKKRAKRWGHGKHCALVFLVSVTICAIAKWKWKQRAEKRAWLLPKQRVAKKYRTLRNRFARLRSKLRSRRI